MAKVWINPAYKKKEKKEEAKPKKEVSPFSGPQKASKKFLQKLVDGKTLISVVFCDTSSVEGKLKWFDNHSISFEADGKEELFDTKNIIYYRC